MEKFDFDSAKRGAAVCTRAGQSVRIVCFDANNSLFSIVAMVRSCATKEETIQAYREDGGWFPANTECNQDLMMRDDDYLERLERGEYEDHFADASKMIAPTVKENSTVEPPTCKDSLPVGMTRREWFAGMALAGEIAGFIAGERDVNDEQKGVPKVIAEDAVLFADTLIAELGKSE